MGPEEMMVQQQPQPLRPVYQMSTTNKSFLNMHYYLKARGIKNNKFMLVLFDPDLAGVDPHDPNLSLIMKQKVTREVVRNYWYFLREVVRVYEDGNPRGVQYRLDRGNMAFHFCTLYNLNIFLELPRQVGKTTSALIRYLYIYNFGSANSIITYLHKDMKASKENLNDTKRLRDMLPPYLQMAQEFSIVNGKKKKMPTTVEKIQNPITHNVINTLPSARNAMLASNLLRGKTITMLWADEWAFIKYNDIIYSNGMPALNTAFRNAARNNAPHGFIITTTAGILSDEAGVYAYKMVQNATRFNEQWYDLSYKDLMELIDANVNSIFVHIRFGYDELGLGEHWFADICRKMNYDMVRIRREILLEWIDKPENSPFNANDLETIRGLTREPMKTVLLLNKYNFNIYSINGTMSAAHPEGLGIQLNTRNVPMDPPIIGVDPSGGYQRDYSAICVIDSRTTEVIAELKCNYISPPDLCRCIYYIVTTMMPNAIVNIERNGGFGASIIHRLRETSIKDNLYFEYKDRVVEETNDDFGRVIRRKQKTKVFGLDSSKGTRDELIQILRERVELHKDKFKSKLILDELEKMTVKRNGKVEHSDNSHDDLTFAYLMALFVWYNGKNLKENWGLNKTTIKTEEDVDEIVGIPEEEQKYVDIVEEMVVNDDDKIAKEVERQLKELKAGIGMTVDEFYRKQQAKEEEQFKMMMQNRVFLEAYAKFSQTPINELESLYGTGSRTTIPNTVFLGADADLIEQMEHEKNFALAKVKIEN